MTLTSRQTERRSIPLLPLRGVLVFPGMVLHLDVGRAKSVRALEQVMVEDQEIILASQVDLSVDEPAKEDLYEVGTLAYVKQMVKMPNGTTRILVEGLKRATIEQFNENDEYYDVQSQFLNNHQMLTMRRQQL